MIPQKTSQQPLHYVNQLGLLLVKNGLQPHAAVMRGNQTCHAPQFDPIRPNSTQFETRILGPCFLDEAFFRTFYAEQTTPLYQPLHPTGLPDYRTTGLLVYRTTGLPVSIVPPCLPSRNARAPATRAVATTPRPASESDGATRPAHAAENERHTTRGSPVICTWSAFWPVAKICKNIEAVV